MAEAPYEHRQGKDSEPGVHQRVWAAFYKVNRQGLQGLAWGPGAYLGAGGLPGGRGPEFPDYLTHLVLRDKPLPKNA